MPSRNLLRTLFVLASLLCCASGVKADSTVTALTAASALNGAELLYCVQAAADRKCTITQVQTFVLATPTITGTTTFGAITGSTQCLHVNTSGVLSGTGSDCAAGGGGLTVGTTTVSGGVAGNLLYTDGTLLQASGGVTWAGTGQLVIALGTITTNLKGLSITGTWNNVATTFDAPLFVNITNTTSAAGSMLADLQVSGSPQFRVSPVGDITIGNNILFAQSSGLGQWGLQLNTGSQFLDIYVNNVATVRYLGNAVPVSGGWSFGASVSSPDIYLQRDAAQILAQRNGTNAQTNRVYNTFTDASNYERGVMDWTTSANTLIIGTQNAGTGAARAMNLVTSGTNAITISTAQLVALPAITTDATHTDATVCEDTTTHALYFGSGAAGICLGTSSIRFKQDIAPLNAGLDDLLKVETVRYRYRPGYGDTSRQLYGFTAEQMAEALPELVGRDGEGKPNSVDWAGMVPVLVRAIQQQQMQIDELKRRVK